MAIVDDFNVLARLVKADLVINDDPDWRLHVCVEAPDLPEMELRRPNILRPSGLKTGFEHFDARVVVSSAMPGVLRRFGSAATRQAALGFEDLAGGFTVRDGHLRAWMTHSAEPVTAAFFIQRAVALRAALSVDPWAGLRERGLEQVEPDCFRGAACEVALIRGPTTRVILDGTFPMTCLRADAAKLKGRVDTRNPVIDQLVSVAGVESVILPYLDDEDFVEALLELVHGNPGSALWLTRLSLQRPGIVEDVAGLLSEAQDFARRLGSR